MINTDNIDNKITSHIKQLDKLFDETLDVPFPYFKEYFKTNDDISVQNFFKLLEGGNEGGN